MQKDYKSNTTQAQGKLHNEDKNKVCSKLKLNLNAPDFNPEDNNYNKVNLNNITNNNTTLQMPIPIRQINTKNILQVYKEEKVNDIYKRIITKDNQNEKEL